MGNFSGLRKTCYVLIGILYIADFSTAKSCSCEKEDAEAMESGEMVCIENGVDVSSICTVTCKGLKVDDDQTSCFIKHCIKKKGNGYCTDKGAGSITHTLNECDDHIIGGNPYHGVYC